MISILRGFPLVAEFVVNWLPLTCQSALHYFIKGSMEAWGSPVTEQALTFKVAAESMWDVLVRVLFFETWFQWPRNYSGVPALFKAYIVNKEYEKCVSLATNTSEILPSSKPKLNSCFYMCTHKPEEIIRHIASSRMSTDMLICT